MKVIERLAGDLEFGCGSLTAVGMALITPVGGQARALRKGH